MSVAANEAFAALPYLKGGVQKLLLPGVGKKVGRLSAFARQMDFLNGADTGTRATDEKLGTAHVAQEGIAELVDVHLAYAWVPTPLLHEARIGIHSPDFATTIQDSHGPKVRATGGMVRMPEDPSLQVEGGARFSGSFEVVAASVSRRQAGRFVVAAKMNDPEVLAMFPYAEDALDVYFLLQAGQRVD